jgi:hypothetical protein
MHPELVWEVGIGRRPSDGLEVLYKCAAGVVDPLHDDRYGDVHDGDDSYAGPQSPRRVPGSLANVTDVFNRCRDEDE